MGRLIESFGNRTELYLEKNEYNKRYKNKDILDKLMGDSVVKKATIKIDNWSMDIINGDYNYRELYGLTLDQILQPLRESPEILEDMILSFEHKEFINNIMFTIKKERISLVLKDGLLIPKFYINLKVGDEIKRFIEIYTNSYYNEFINQLIVENEKNNHDDLITDFNELCEIDGDYFIGRFFREIKNNEDDYKKVNIRKIIFQGSFYYILDELTLKALEIDLTRGKSFLKDTKYIFNDRGQICKDKKILSAIKAKLAFLT